MRDARGGVEVVHRDDAGDAVARDDVGEQVVELEAVADVEEGRRLVEEKHARPCCARARATATRRCSPPLSVSTGRSATAREVAAGDGVVDGRGVLGPLAHPAVLVRRPPHARPPRARGTRRRAARSGARARPTRAASRRSIAAHVRPRERHRARGRREEPRRDAEQGRLPRPVRPEERRHLALHARPRGSRPRRAGAPPGPRSAPSTRVELHRGVMACRCARFSHV